MDKYPLKSIGDLCDIVKGETGLASATPGMYPLVATGAERRSSVSYQFDTEAVCIPLVSSTGHGKKTLNYVHYQEGKFALGTILCALVPKDKTKLSAAYLHRYLKFNKDRKLVSLMKGAANVSLAVRDIAKIEIPVPPILIQKEFITLFNKLDETGTALQGEFTTQTSLLTQLRQAILQEAIEGKLTADWRKAHPVCKGDPETDAEALLAKIKTEKQKLIATGKIKKKKPLSPISPEDSPFSLPQGWVWTRLGEISETLSTGPFGSMLHRTDYVHKGIPVVNPTNISENGILPDVRMMISKTTASRLSRYLLKENDIVIARRGNLSKCARVDIAQENWLCGTGSFFMRLSEIDRSFFVLIYRSQYAQFYLLQDSIGQTMDNLNQKLLSKLPLAVPPLAEQRAIVERVKKFLYLVDQLETQVTVRKSHADALLQTVLRDAFEG